MKKLLALVLALVMTLGLATVGANAAAFTDADKIEHDEAVQVLNALGVLAGFPDGSFGPTGDVTRAQMAKMITIILLGEGVDASSFVGVKTNLTDINGHWAEGYIKYCLSQGIVAGRGDGKFYPDDNVTIAEAAKMLLTALGYNADVQEYTGSTWAINVIRDAQNKKLFEDLSGIKSEDKANRDQSAQMIWNTIQRGMIVKQGTQERDNNGKISDSYRDTDITGPVITLLGRTFEGQIWVGTMDGNYNTGSTGNTKGAIRLANAGDVNAPAAGRVATPFFKSDLDISNIGEEVKVVFKDNRGGTANTPDKDDTIFGVYNTGSTNVVKAKLGDIKDTLTKDNKIEINGEKYNVAYTAAVGANVYRNYDIAGIAAADTNIGAAAASDAAANGAWLGQVQAPNGNEIKIILNGDGKITDAYITETALSYISAINSEKVSIPGLGAIKIADNSIYSGAAKNDIVTYTKLYAGDNEFTTVEKAEKIEGTFQSYKVDAGNNLTKLTVDGTAYDTYQTTNAPLGTHVVTLPAVAVDGTAGIVAGDADDINEKYALYMVNGYVGRVELASVGMKDYALVLEFAGTFDSSFDPAKVQLLLADGTKTTVEIHKDSVIYTLGADAAGTKLAKGAAINTGLVAGALVKYAKISDSVYKIEVVGATGDATAAGAMAIPTANAVNTAFYDKDTKQINTAADAAAPVWVVGSGAVLFAKDTTNNSYKAYEINSLNNIVLPLATSGFNFFVKDGKVVAAYAELGGRPSGASSNTFYGIVTSVDGVSKDSEGSSYRNYTVSNDTGDQKVSIPDTAANAGLIPAKGDLVGFDIVSDNIYNVGELTVFTGAAANEFRVWVKEYSEKDQTISFYVAGDVTAKTPATATSPATNYTNDNPATTLAVDKECKIVYVDQDADKGGSNVGVGEFDGVTGYFNALIVKDATTGKVIGVIVESSGETNVM